MVKIRQLIWDGGNIRHISKHQIVPDEVTEVCRFVAKTFKTYRGRVVILGKTRKGRWLTIILASKGKNKLYVVTARDMSRKERRLLK